MQTQRSGEAPFPAEPEAQERALEQEGGGMDSEQIIRAATAVIGGVLVAGGLRRRSLGGTLLALAGGELLRHAATGQSLVGMGIRLLSDVLNRERGPMRSSPF